MSKYPAKIYKYKKGSSLTARIYGGLCGASEFRATAEYLVENLNKEELKEYIADMLYGIELIKIHQRSVDGFDFAKQFGIKFVNE